MKEWGKYSFGDIVERKTERYNPNKSDINYKCIELSNLESKTGRLLDLSDSQDQKSSKYKFNKGNVLYSKLRPYLKKYYFPEFEGVCSSEIWVLEANEQIIYNEYLYYLIQTERFNQIANVTSGTRMPRANWRFVSQSTFKIPPLEKQRQIIDILSTWEKEINLKERLLENKKKIRKALMQKLLTGKIRLDRFNKKWKKVKMKDVLEPVKREIKWDNNKLYKLVSIKRNSGGLFFREELYGHEIKTKNLQPIKENDFLISKMQVVHGALSIVEQEFEDMFVSGSYIILNSKDKSRLNMRFFDYLTQLPQMYHKAYTSSYGVHIEKMTFNLDLYLNENILIPSEVEEQMAIVEILKTADNEINLIKEEIAKIKKQKKGLIQNLLSGKIDL